MNMVKEQLGEKVCTNILFIHAILGRDTTLHCYGIGKQKSYKKYEQAKVFDVTISKEDIAVAGEKALVCLHSGIYDDTFNVLRHKHFCEKVAKKSIYFQPQSLPPTLAAAKYYSLRVYFQIRKWKCSENSMDPEEWGWKSTGRLLPVITDLQPAPDNILCVIRCNCHADYNSSKCTCRKHNLVCSSVCGQCKGSECTNSTIPTSTNEEDDGLDVEDEKEVETGH